jgi:hypothetical protein
MPAVKQRRAETAVPADEERYCYLDTTIRNKKRLLSTPSWREKKNRIEKELRFLKPPCHLRRRNHRLKSVGCWGGRVTLLPSGHSMDKSTEARSHLEDDAVDVWYSV